MNTRTKSSAPTADFDVADHGSVILLTPLTEAACEFAAESIDVQFSWGPAIVCDHRPGWHLVGVIQDAGFAVTVH